MKLGKNIMKIREDNGLTQEKFAEILCVSRQTVSNWETDKCIPDVETLKLMSNYFHVSLDTLFDNVVEKPTPKRRMSMKTKLFVGLSFLVSVVLFWYTYKRVLIYYYRDEIGNELNIKRFKNFSVIGNEELANARFMGLNIYVPDELERNMDDEDINERKYFKDGVLAMWLSKGGSYLGTAPLGDGRLEHVDRRELLEKYRCYKEDDLVDYYFEHRYEEASVFWSKSRIQMNYLSKNYVKAISYGGGDIYEVDGNRIRGYIYDNGEYLVARLDFGEQLYVIRFNKSLYNLGDIEKLLQGVFIDNLYMGDLAYAKS